MVAVLFSITATIRKATKSPSRPFEEITVNGECAANPVHASTEGKAAALHKQLNRGNLTLHYLCSVLDDLQKFLRRQQASLVSIQGGLRDIQRSQALLASRLGCSEQIEIPQYAGGLSDLSDEEEQSSDVVLHHQDFASPTIPGVGTSPGAATSVPQRFTPFGSNPGSVGGNFGGRLFAFKGGFLSGGFSNSFAGQASSLPPWKKTFQNDDLSHMVIAGRSVFPDLHRHEKESELQCKGRDPLETCLHLSLPRATTKNPIWRKTRLEGSTFSVYPYYTLD